MDLLTLWHFNRSATSSPSSSFSGSTVEHRIVFHLLLVVLQRHRQLRDLHRLDHPRLTSASELLRWPRDSRIALLEWPCANLLLLVVLPPRQKGSRDSITRAVDLLPESAALCSILPADERD
jgi:hypothetical protein